MPQLKCICKHIYSKTEEEIKTQVGCPKCGWSLEPSEIERYLYSATGKVAKKTQDSKEDDA